MKSKKAIENILKNYFKSDYLDFYLSYYSRSIKKFDKTLFKEVEKIQHEFSHVDNDVIYFLTYAFREILKEESNFDYKAESKVARHVRKTELELGYLLQSIEKHKRRDKSVSIVYGGKTFKFQDSKVFEDLSSFVKKTFYEKLTDDEPGKKINEPLHVTIEIMEFLNEPFVKTKNEASPYYDAIKEFAFFVFKYLSNDSMFHPTTGVPNHIRFSTWKEEYTSPRVTHLYYIARLYQLAHVRIGQRSEHLKNIIDTNVFKLRNQEVPAQFSDVIKKHIKDYRLMHKVISPSKTKD